MEKNERESNSYLTNVQYKLIVGFFGAVLVIPLIFNYLQEFWISHPRD